MIPHHRTVLGAALIVIGALGLLAGAFLSDASRLLRPAAFADRVAFSLTDERVSSLAAEYVADAVIAQRRDLTAVRPLILAASHDVVRSAAFRGLVRTAAERAHATLFSRMGRSVVISIPDLEVVLRGALAGSPAVAAAIPSAITVGLAGAQEHPAMRVALVLMRSGFALVRYAWLALIGGTIILGCGVLIMLDRRDALVAAGAALMVAGIGLWSILPVGEAILSSLADSSRTSGALAALWTVALGGVRRWGMLYGGIGVTLAAAGSSLLERLDARDLGNRIRALVTTRPLRADARLARGIAITAAGMLVVFAPGAAIALLTVTTGLLIAFVGLREVFAVVLHAAPAQAGFGHALNESREGWLVGGVVVICLAALFGGAVAATGTPDVHGRTVVEVDACNGGATLCDRRVDEVVFAGTHNSMASADAPGWLFPQQERGIETQLQDGVRALLVDVHYGTRTRDGVRTHMTPEKRAEAERVLGAEGFAAAMRIRDRIVSGAATDSALFLCHALCELGALPLDSTLRAVAQFLATHPHEVVIMVIEDYVGPTDLARAFEASGLAALAYRGAAGKPWPTLRELIARNERVITMIESGRSGVPWLLPAFGVLQETPYTFLSPRDTLGCAPNRGGSSGSLFLLNHWIQTTPAARPSNAAIVNAEDVLSERARRCETSRGRRPNIVAVDFYRTGDLLRVTRISNGLGPPR